MQGWGSGSSAGSAKRPSSTGVRHGMLPCTRSDRRRTRKRTRRSGSWRGSAMASCGRPGMICDAAPDPLGTAAADRRHLAYGRSMASGTLALAAFQPARSAESWGHVRSHPPPRSDDARRMLAHDSRWEMKNAYLGTLDCHTCPHCPQHITNQKRPPRFCSRGDHRPDNDAVLCLLTNERAHRLKPTPCVIAASSWAVPIARRRLPLPPCATPACAASWWQAPRDLQLVA